MGGHQVLGHHLPAEGAGDPGVRVAPADVDLDPPPGHHLVTQVTLDSANNLFFGNLIFFKIVCVI